MKLSWKSGLMKYAEVLSFWTRKEDFSCNVWYANTKIDSIKQIIKTEIQR